MLGNSPKFNYVKLETVKFLYLQSKKLLPDYHSCKRLQHFTKHFGMADSATELKAKVDDQGDKVRQLKTSGASKDEVDREVKVLLELKAEYKKLTGQDLAGGDGRGKKTEKQSANSEKNEVDKSESGDGAGAKKVTRYFCYIYVFDINGLLVLALSYLKISNFRQGVSAFLLYFCLSFLFQAWT